MKNTSFALAVGLLLGVGGTMQSAGALDVFAQWVGAYDTTGIGPLDITDSMADGTNFYVRASYGWEGAVRRSYWTVEVRLDDTVVATNYGTGEFYWNSPTYEEIFQTQLVARTGRHTLQFMIDSAGTSGDSTPANNIVTRTFTVRGPASGDLFGGGEMGSGWRSSSWFGDYNATYAPWYYHLEHQWLYVTGSDAASLWLHAPGQGWLWTSAELYPWLYRGNPAAWLFYVRGSSAPRWFYNVTAGGWEQF